MSDTPTPETGYERLRTVIIGAIETCPEGQENALRRRLQEFAAGLDPEDLAIIEQVIADLNEGPDVRLEHELAARLAEFLKIKPAPTIADPNMLSPFSPGGI